MGTNGTVAIPDEKDFDEITELSFYKRYGFKVMGRSEKDATGRDYPILNLAINS